MGELHDLVWQLLVDSASSWPWSDCVGAPWVAVGEGRGGDRNAGMSVPFITSAELVVGVSLLYSMRVSSVVAGRNAVVG